jgi:hypothetical protein
LHQKGPHPAQWQQESGVSEERFSQMCNWVESYLGQSLQRPRPEIEHVWLALAKQMREELSSLLAELEPTHAMALLCHLPTAHQRGYSWQRLAGRLHVEEGQLLEWEGQAYVSLLERVGEQTPFLQFLSQRIQEAEETAEQLQAKLIEQAAHDPSFDLRRYLLPSFELAIRQAYHRVGVNEGDRVLTLFAEEDRWLVELVGARIQLETTGVEEERDDA